MELILEKEIELKAANFEYRYMISLIPCLDFSVHFNIY